MTSTQRLRVQNAPLNASWSPKHLMRRLMNWMHSILRPRLTPRCPRTQPPAPMPPPHRHPRRSPMHPPGRRNSAGWAGRASAPHDGEIGLDVPETHTRRFRDRQAADHPICPLERLPQSLPFALHGVSHVFHGHQFRWGAPTFRDGRTGTALCQGRPHQMSVSCRNVVRYWAEMALAIPNVH